MAVETKIGLVVGLGFIVCFAVVLSHRGTGDQLSARMAYDLLSKHGREARKRPVDKPKTYVRADAGHDKEDRPVRMPPAVPKRAAAKDGDPAPDKTAGGRNAASTDRRRSSTVNERRRRAHGTKSKTGPGVPPGRPHRRVSAAGKAPPIEKGGGVRERASQRTPTRKPPKQGEASAETKKVKKPPSFEELFGGDGGGEADTSGAPAGTTGLSEKKDVKPPSPRRPAKSKLQPRKREPAADAPKGARYVVQPRDTLWGIAKKAYGSSSGKIVDAIFAANRERLATPDKLRIGTELALPTIKDVGAPRAGTADTGNRVTAKPKVRDVGRPSDQPEYYQIKQGDRYATIARRFLGSSARWKEIHELNKEIFPDPSRIRYGVRIRLPKS